MWKFFYGVISTKETTPQGVAVVNENGMEWGKAIFGEDESISALQMCCRALAVFLVALVLVRIAGLRTFGKRSAVDTVVMIMLGAVLSRAVTGASPMIPVFFASAAMVLIHRVLAWLSLYSDKVGRVVKGRHRRLYYRGGFDRKNMKRLLISERDIMEGVRIQIDEDSLDNVHAVYIERNGQISVVKKGNQTGTEFYP